MVLCIFYIFSVLGLINCLMAIVNTSYRKAYGWLFWYFFVGMSVSGVINAWLNNG